MDTKNSRTTDRGERERGAKVDAKEQQQRETSRGGGGPDPVRRKGRGSVGVYGVWWGGGRQSGVGVVDTAVDAPLRCTLLREGGGRGSVTL